MIRNEYYKDIVNLGDSLAKIIFEWMVEEQQIVDENENEILLLTVGSVLESCKFRTSSVVWGTGIHFLEDIVKISNDRKNRCLDIRAVRGPLTKRALEMAGYVCPNIFGDPAIMMPLIYEPKVTRKKGKISLIRHCNSSDLVCPDILNNIDIRTIDYKNVINEICSSEKIISSSLHGIILSETYGIPCVFLLENMEEELLKFYDWYWATERKEVRYVYSIEEAIASEGMPLPDLKFMRERLYRCFPKDIFLKNYCIHNTLKKIVLYGAGNCFLNNIKQLKKICNIDYVIDSDCTKWGEIEGVICLSLERILDKLDDFFVVITLYNQESIDEVSKLLIDREIYYFDTVKKFLKYENYENFY